MAWRIRAYTIHRNSKRKQRTDFGEYLLAHWISNRHKRFSSSKVAALRKYLWQGREIRCYSWDERNLYNASQSFWVTDSIVQEQYLSVMQENPIHSHCSCKVEGTITKWQQSREAGICLSCKVGALKLNPANYFLYTNRQYTVEINDGRIPKGNQVRYLQNKKGQKSDKLQNPKSLFLFLCAPSAPPQLHGWVCKDWIKVKLCGCKLVFVLYTPTGCQGYLFSDSDFCVVKTGSFKQHLDYLSTHKRHPANTQQMSEWLSGSQMPPWLCKEQQWADRTVLALSC